ncbi:transposase [Pseudoalteromonas sp.]|uniref:REP-associated tyrosine transposase n=1 Tax=Pseudoalteromonas sp. TaxID=53249 RepID=UPI001BCB8C8F|nr:transposase [Pseudoalteromonas sp.]
MKKSQNLRTGRISIPNHFYSVTLVINNRQRLLSDLSLNRKIIYEIKQLEEEGACKSIAFVFMPDHIHWLFQLKVSMHLSALIRLFKGRCTKLAREHYKINKLWQNDYYDHMIRDEKDLINYARYIIANPLRANIVNNVGDYPFWDCIYLK